MVFIEKEMLGIYIEGLLPSIRGEVSSFWTEHGLADMDALAWPATTVDRLTGSLRYHEGQRTPRVLNEESGSDGTSTVYERYLPTPRKEPSYHGHENTAQTLLITDESIFNNELLMMQSVGRPK